APAPQVGGRVSPVPKAKSAPALAAEAAPSAPAPSAQPEIPELAPGTPLMGNEADCGPVEEPYRDSPRPNVGPCRRTYYGEAEILYWFIRRGSVPPLLTTGDPGGFGVIGTDNTRVLLDNLNFDQGHRVGGRFIFGFWAANLPRIAFEA